MRPELVFEFLAPYELVFHDRIPRETGLPVWQLPSATTPDPQQELARAPIVEVRPAKGAPWVGIFFADGSAGDPGMLIAWPDETSLCYFGGGGAYVVDPRDPAKVELVEGWQLQQCFVVADAGIILFAEWSNLVAYDREGVLWSSPRLTLDDLRVVDVEGDVITCTGFFGGRSDVSFTVDLRTGTTSDAPMTFDD